MPIIDDFVNHRWADAKEALRDQDPDFVTKVEDLVREDESRNRLLYLPIGAMPAFEVNETPRKPLSTEWHNLLGSCNEITRQADIVLMVAANLSGCLNTETPDELAGRQFIYHFRSFPIHATTLFENANDVILKTLTVFLDDQASIYILRRRYKQAIEQKTPKFLHKVRNSYLHATEKYWSRKITEEENWEPAVAIGQTPRTALDKLLYPQQGSRFKSGKYTHFMDAAEIFLNDIGKVLHDLEQDLKANYKLKYPMG